MASYKFIRKSNKQRKNGQAPIVCRITHNRKHAEFKLGFSVLENEWNEDKQRVKGLNTNYKRFNLSLSHKGHNIEKIALEFESKGKFYSAQDIKSEVLGKCSTEFISFANGFINGKYKNRDIEISTFKKYQVVISKLSEFVSGSIPINQINSEFLSKYETYLRTKKKNSTNTIGINMKCIRAIIKELIREGKIKVDNYPFLRYKIKSEEVARKFLFVEEIESIRNINLEPNSAIAQARNIFLFCLETGLRIGDALFLKKENFHDDIHYYSQKTKVYEMLPLTNRAKILLETAIASTDESYLYAFNYLRDKYMDDAISRLNEKKRKTALINKYLKQIGQKLNLSISLSSHVARHSMAVNALSKGLSYAEIQSLLNHSDVETTQIYAKTHNRMKMEAVRKLN